MANTGRIPLWLVGWSGTTRHLRCPCWNRDTLTTQFANARAVQVSLGTALDDDMWVGALSPSSFACRGPTGIQREDLTEQEAAACVSDFDAFLDFPIATYNELSTESCPCSGHAKRVGSVIVMEDLVMPHASTSACKGADGRLRSLTTSTLEACEMDLFCDSVETALILSAKVMN